MAASVKILGAAPALLLLAATLLAAEDRAYKVTWDRCKEYPDYGERFRDESLDNEATTLDVKNCQITEITTADLHGLPKLGYVYLNENKIRHVDPAVFSAVPLVKYLFLNNNSLTEMPVFGSASVLPNLRAVNLAINQITKLDDPKTFSSTKELRTLNLESNLIEHINPDVFQGLPHLDAIYLKDNKLTYIPDKMFAIPSLDYVGLGKNLIEYVAPGAFRGTRLGYLLLSDNKLTHLPEHFVSDLTSNGGKLRYFHFHNNPLQCPCLSELIAEVKQVDNCDYASQHYTTESPMCQQTNDSQCKRLTETEYTSSRSVKGN